MLFAKIPVQLNTSRVRVYLGQELPFVLYNGPLSKKVYPTAGKSTLKTFSTETFNIISRHHNEINPQIPIIVSIIIKSWDSWTHLSPNSISLWIKFPILYHFIHLSFTISLNDSFKEHNHISNIRRKSWFLSSLPN